MNINASGWRPEMGGSEVADAGTTTGNRALMLEEALIFEIGDRETRGTVRSALQVYPNPKRCAIIRA